MILCPHCNKGAKEIAVSGPVLWAKGVIEIDDDGIIVAISPLTAIQTIRAGEELKDSSLTFECPTCHFAGPRELFKIMSVCVISGQPTDYQIETPFGSIFIVRELEAQARTIFSEARANWEVRVQREDLIHV